MMATGSLHTEFSEARYTVRKATHTGLSFRVLLKYGYHIVSDESVPRRISLKALVQDIIGGQHEHAVMVVRILDGVCKDRTERIAALVFEELDYPEELPRGLPSFVHDYADRQGHLVFERRQDADYEADHLRSLGGRL